MSLSNRDQYLESKTLTAPTHRLHLMLIEGAIRLGRQAEEALRRGDLAAANPPLTRMIEIVGELLAGVRGQETDLNKQIADLYWYLFRSVTEAKINDDAEKLSVALKLLEFERETWRLVNEKLSSQSVDSKSFSNASSHITPPRPPIVSRSFVPNSPHSPASSTSLEA